MANAKWIVITATDESKEMPANVAAATFINLGSANGTLTQDGQTMVLPPNIPFNLNERHNTNGWKAVTINASGTVIQCTYII